MNIATVLAGCYDEDVFTTLTWTRTLQTRYAYQVYIACKSKRSEYVAKLLAAYPGEPISLNPFYESPYANTCHDMSTQKALENWLNVSFRYLTSLDWRFFDRARHKDRRKVEDMYDYLTSLTNFFRDFFVRNDIEVLVTNLEGVAYALISYYVAKRLGIPIVTLNTGRFPKNSLMFCKDNFSDIWVWNDSNAEENEWEEISALYGNGMLIDKSKVVVGTEYRNPKSVFESLAKAIRYTSSRRAMIKLCQCDKYVTPSTTMLAKRVIQTAIRKILNKPFFNKPNNKDEYFFFPLHYENDAQITAREPFIDQFRLVKAISRGLPQQTYLYVKPHPYYLGTDVRPQDLRALSRLRNIKLIEPTISSISLIKGSIGVITINSTTGFEAMIFNKPVISLGHDFYCRDDLCYIVRDMNELPRVIFKVFLERKPPSSADHIKEFVKMVYRNTIFTEGIFSPVLPNRITDDDGAKIASALDKIFRKIKIQQPQNITHNLNG